VPEIELPERRIPMPGEAERVSAAIEKAHAMFTSLGATAQDGADLEVPVRFVTDPGAGFWRVLDTIDIGVGPRGTSYGVDDVVVHEYAHRVIGRMLDLTPLGQQPSEVDESLADIFASVVDPDWTVGEDVKPGGFRDMADPGRFGDPGFVRDYVATDDPHINAGIMNRAASLIGERLGRQAMGQIYFDTVRDHLDGESGLVDVAVGTLRAASARHGGRSAELQAVTEAWDAVGLLEPAQRRTMEERYGGRSAHVRKAAPESAYIGPVEEPLSDEWKNWFG
jgi:Thermolysin metallopeptidase, alpha-helical domain